MPDYSKMSEAELKAIAGAEDSTGPDYSKMSNEELMHIATGGELQEQSFGDKILGGISAVGEFIDKWAGAPTRSALDATIETGTPAIPAKIRFTKGGPVLERPEMRMDDRSPLLEGAKAFGRQFGEDPALAPTGKDIASKRLGISTEETLELPGIGKFSPAGAVGLGVDVTADVSNLIPVVGIAKIAGKGAAVGAKAGTKMVMKGSAAAAEKLSPEIIKKVAATSKVAMSKLFNPTQAKDFTELADIATRNGIDTKILPDAVEFGERSLISKAKRVSNEGVWGEQALENFHKNLSKVQEATDNTIAKIGGGQVLKPAEAGVYIRQSFDNAVDEFFGKIDVSYNTIIKDYPGLALSESAVKKLDSAISGVESFAKGRVKRGVDQVQRTQGQGLLNAVAAIRAGNGSVKQTVEALRDIGEASFKSQNTLAAIPADVAKMRKLYGDISEALIDTIRTETQEGEKLAGALQINNKLMSEFFGEKSIIEKAIGNKALAPEGVFRQLIQNGDTRKIEALRAILPPEAMQSLKASYLDSLIKRTEGAEFSFRRLRNTLQNSQVQTRVTALLSPEELKGFTEIVWLGDRFGPAVLNTSGTAVSQLFRNIPKAVAGAIANEAFIDILRKRARGQAVVKPVKATAPILQMPKKTVGEFLGIKIPQTVYTQTRPPQFGERETN